MGLLYNNNTQKGKNGVIIVSCETPVQIYSDPSGFEWHYHACNLGTSKTTSCSIMSTSSSLPNVICLATCYSYYSYGLKLSHFILSGGNKSTFPRCRLCQNFVATRFSDMSASANKYACQWWLWHGNRRLTALLFLIGLQSSRWH